MITIIIIKVIQRRVVMECVSGIPLGSIRNATGVKYMDIIYIKQLIDKEVCLK